MRFKPHFEFRASLSRNNLQSLLFWRVYITTLIGLTGKKSYRRWFYLLFFCLLVAVHGKYNVFHAIKQLSFNLNTRAAHTLLMSEMKLDDIAIHHRVYIIVLIFRQLFEYAIFRYQFLIVDKIVIDKSNTDTICMFANFRRKFLFKQKQWKFSCNWCLKTTAITV